MTLVWSLNNCVVRELDNAATVSVERVSRPGSAVNSDMGHYEANQIIDKCETVHCVHVGSDLVGLVTRLEHGRVMLDAIVRTELKFLGQAELWLRFGLVMRQEYPEAWDDDLLYLWMRWQYLCGTPCQLHATGLVKLFYALNWSQVTQLGEARRNIQLDEEGGAQPVAEIAVQASWTAAQRRFLEELHNPLRAAARREAEPQAGGPQPAEATDMSLEAQWRRAQVRHVAPTYPFGNPGPTGPRGVQGYTGIAGPVGVQQAARRPEANAYIASRLDQDRVHDQLLTSVGVPNEMQAAYREMSGADAPSTGSSILDGVTGNTIEANGGSGGNGGYQIMETGMTVGLDTSRFDRMESDIQRLTGVLTSLISRLMPHDGMLHQDPRLSDQRAADNRLMALQQAAAARQAAAAPTRTQYPLPRSQDC